MADTDPSEVGPEETGEISGVTEDGGLWETVKTVIIAIAIAMVIRTVAYEPFNIPSGSMKPTLLVGDYLFVSKFSYGYSRYSLPFALPLIPGRVMFTEPKRGDVAVFKLPTDRSTDYIKRIVGLPGDKVQVVKGILHINGAAVKRTMKRNRRDYVIQMQGYCSDCGHTQGCPEHMASLTDIDRPAEYFTHQMVIHSRKIRA